MLSPSPRLLGVAVAAWTVACAPIHDDATTAADEFSVNPQAREQGDPLPVEWGEIDPSEPDDDPRCWTGVAPSELVAVDEPFEAGSGRMIVRGEPSTGTQPVALPLTETSFDTVVTGTIAETSVTQVFNNPFDHTIEAVYVFPLPDDGAVDDYWFHVGERHIHGVMKKREEARELYERAREQGHTAALLEQDRPNIFTQSVANIAPGESVEVEMHLVQPLHQEQGRYELALPTVVGPRFIPGQPTGKQAGGWAPDTGQVPDASRITPPVAPPGHVTCAKLSVSVIVDPGLPVGDFRSKYHSVTATPAGRGVAIELAHPDELPNRDFVLSWEASGAAPRASLLAQRREAEGWFTLTIQPPESVSIEQARSRELIFVVDTSGSMSGAPLETAKAAIRHSLNRLGPDDAFQIIRFDDSASTLGSGPLPNTPANLERGRNYVDELQGMGGTQMVEGIKAALSMPHERERMRIVLFLTDGYIGNEQEIFGAIEQRIGDTRLFSLGVGDSVNRYLLDGMAKIGRGAVTYVGLREQPDEVVDRFYERIDRPVLTDVEIDWGELGVRDVVPAAIPDLFAGQPVVVFGRFEGRAKGVATLRGQQGGREVRVTVPIDTAANDEGTGLASMWARKRIDDLLNYPRLGPDARATDPGAGNTRERVVDLALEYRVMTQYTSFVAVDEQRVADPDGSYRTVQVPVEIPRGVSHEAVFGADAWGGLVGTEIGESYGMGGLGLTGTGGGGGRGSGRGAGLGGKGKRVPRVRSAEPNVMGSIDKDQVRRIIRAHVTEVRKCYEAGLGADPNLRGRLVLELVIDMQGTVTATRIVEDSLADATVGECVAARATRWKFPGNPAGLITIRYPFVLSPG